MGTCFGHGCVPEVQASQWAGRHWRSQMQIRGLVLSLSTSESVSLSICGLYSCPLTQTTSGRPPESLSLLLLLSLLMLSSGLYRCPFRRTAKDRGTEMLRRPHALLPRPMLPSVLLLPLPPLLLLSSLLIIVVNFRRRRLFTISVLLLSLLLLLLLLLSSLL